MVEVLASLCDCDFNPLDVLHGLDGHAVRITVLGTPCAECEGTVYELRAVTR